MENTTMTAENIRDVIENVDNRTNIDSRDIIGYNIVPNSVVLLVKKICYLGIVPCLALTGIVLNSLCLVMFTKLKSKNSTVVFLIALTVIDTFILLNGAFSSLIQFTVIYGSPFSLDIVRLMTPYYSTYINALPGYIGNILTLLIALERLLCVMIPMKIRQYSIKKNATVAVVLCCVCTVVFCLPNLFLYTTENMYSNTTGKFHVVLRQTEFGMQSELINAIFVTISTVYIFIPVVGVTIASGITAAVVMLNARRRSTLTNICSKSRTINKELQVTKTLLIVTSVFVICQMPASVLIMIIIIDPEMTPYRYKNNIYELVYPILYSFIILNSVVNFIIYTVTNNNYKSQFRKLFGKTEVPTGKGDTAIKSSQMKKESEHM